MPFARLATTEIRCSRGSAVPPRSLATSIFRDRASSVTNRTSDRNSEVGVPVARVPLRGTFLLVLARVFQVDVLEPPVDDLRGKIDAVGFDVILARRSRSIIGSEGSRPNLDSEK